MPVYVYRIVRPKRPADIASPEETFEVMPSMHDPPLMRHPQTGEPVERVLTAPHISAGRAGDAQIANAGFTKYKRMSDGTYERQTGTAGPKRVNPREKRKT